MARRFRSLLWQTNSFADKWSMDATFKQGDRITIDEVCAYQVKDGNIVLEQISIDSAICPIVPMIYRGSLGHFLLALTTFLTDLFQMAY